MSYSNGFEYTFTLYTTRSLRNHIVTSYEVVVLFSITIYTWESSIDSDWVFSCHSFYSLLMCNTRLNAFHRGHFMVSTYGTAKGWTKSERIRSNTTIGVTHFTDTTMSKVKGYDALIASTSSSVIDEYRYTQSVKSTWFYSCHDSDVKLICYSSADVVSRNWYSVSSSADTVSVYGECTDGRNSNCFYDSTQNIDCNSSLILSVYVTSIRCHAISHCLLSMGEIGRLCTIRCSGDVVHPRYKK